MANEITVRAQLTYNPSLAGQVGMDSTLQSATLDMTGTEQWATTVDVGTSEEEITPPSDIGTPGMVLVKNLDSTNFIELGSVTGEYLVKLLPGEFAMFRLASSSIFALADTASCKLQIFLLEE